jgi:hypothetical protein
MQLRDIFNKENPKRDKFLSRVFGIFSEEIASIWFDSSQSTYKNLGRPTVYGISLDERRYTLDFALEEKEGKRIYIAEMKCELEYQNYKYLELNKYEQLDHHTGEAFNRFISFASNPKKYKVNVSGKPVIAHGSVLIWGAITQKGKEDVIRKTNIYDVLSLEEMMNDLLHNNEDRFNKLLDTRKEWCTYLFEKLGAV